MSNNIDQNDLNKILKLYFKQPKILYQHLFSSYHQLVEEIIPHNISSSTNYFYESNEKDKIYYHVLNVAI